MPLTRESIALQFTTHDLTDDGIDDSLVSVECVFLVDAAGHMETFARVAAIRPMRELFYLDSNGDQILFGIWLSMLLFLLSKEVVYLRKDGFKEYFFAGQAGFWNMFEVLFFIQIVVYLNRVYSYWLASSPELYC